MPAPTVTANRYSRPTIALHWLMLALIAIVYASMELRGLFPRGSAPRELMKATHFALGISVLALVIVRIAARLPSSTPPITPPPSPAQRLLAGIAHLALYAFMIAMPLLGWLMFSAEGKTVPFFGLDLPPLIGPDKALAHDLEEWHELGATLGYWLIGLHAAAALLHHYVQRDNTLRRMLPGDRPTN